MVKFNFRFVAMVSLAISTTICFLLVIDAIQGNGLRTSPPSRPIISYPRGKSVDKALILSNSSASSMKKTDEKNQTTIVLLANISAPAIPEQKLKKDLTRTKSLLLSPKSLRVGRVTKLWPMPFNYSETGKLYEIDPAALTWNISPLHLANCSTLEEIVRRYQDGLLFSTAISYQGINKTVENSKVKRIFIRLNANECHIWPGCYSDESYSLSVDDSGIILTANDVWGILYGLETLSQLLVIGNNNKIYYIFGISVNDRPRFEHRGLAVDSSTSLLPISVLKENINAMVQNKFNVLHWRLSGGGNDLFPLKLKAFQPQIVDDNENYYTKSDVESVINFARLRGVRVIPEISVPSNVASWQNRLTNSSIFISCGNTTTLLDPTNRHTYRILKRIIVEISELFLENVISIGGDDNKFKLSCWKTLAEQMMVASNNSTLNKNQIIRLRRNLITADPLELLKIFTKRLFNMFHDKTPLHRRYNHHRRVLLGETMYRKLHKLPKYLVVIHVQHSRSHFVRKLAGKGFKVLSSSCWWWPNNQRKLTDGGDDDWRLLYKCDPLPGKDKNFAGMANVLGGEMYIGGLNESNLMPKLWPNALAVAERLWTDHQQQVVDLNEANGRFKQQKCRMIRRGTLVKKLTGNSDDCGEHSVII